MRAPDAVLIAVVGGPVSCTAAIGLVLAACSGRGFPASSSRDTRGCLSRDQLRAAALRMEIDMTEQARTKLGSLSLQAIYDDLLDARRAAVAPRATAPASPVRSPCIPAELELFVQFRDDARPIEQLALGRFFALDPFLDTGVREGAGWFPPESLAALAALPNVIRIGESDTIRTTLDQSLPETGTTDLRTQFSWMTGLGVTIVLIDVGIEWRHGAFMDKDGKSRIQKLWDLTGRDLGPGGRRCRVPEE
jgi:hypothetical protein